MSIDKYISFFVLLLLCLSANVASSQDEKVVTQSEFDQWNNELEYDKMSKKLRWKKQTRKPKKKKKENQKTYSSPNFGFLSGLGGLFNILAYVLIAAMLIGIAYVVFSNVKIDKDIPVQEFTTEDLEEEHIEDIDVESEYEKALRLGDYRLALRLRFLLVLQKLSLNNAIDWKFEKTNRDYSNELRGSSLYNGFKNLAGIFAWVWYGNNQLSKEEFDQYMIYFDQFKTESA